MNRENAASGLSMPRNPPKTPGIMAIENGGAPKKDLSFDEIISLYSVEKVKPEIRKARLIQRFTSFVQQYKTED